MSRRMVVERAPDRAHPGQGQRPRHGTAALPGAAPQG